MIKLEYKNLDPTPNKKIQNSIFCQKTIITFNLLLIQVITN